MVIRNYIMDAFQHLVQVDVYFTDFFKAFHRMDHSIPL